MTEVVICVQHGGFGLSRAAFLRLRELGSPEALGEPDIGEVWPGTDQVRGVYLDSFCAGIGRDDSLLLQVVKELGCEAASAPLCTLRVVELPDGVGWQVEEYDGLEWVAEKHRVWGLGNG